MDFVYVNAKLLIVYDNNINAIWYGKKKGMHVNYCPTVPDFLLPTLKLFMPPTLEKLKGHIAFGLSVRPSVHASVQNLLIYSFEIPYMDSSSINN